MTLNKNTKIYVAGHRGLVGSAIWNNLEARGYHHLVGRTHAELDLTDQAAVRRFFDRERPEVVVLAAAYVGGIMANSLYRADFIMQNMQMQCNVISESYAHDVRKLLFLGSTCIYPKDAPQPMEETALLTSPLEYTNEPYAIAKIAGLKMCESYNLQYGTDYIAVMPTNLYGPNDNFHLDNSHVMPAMMRKIYLAQLIHKGRWDMIKRDLDSRPVHGIDGSATQADIERTLARYGIYNHRVVLWGTGHPLREFLWSEDMADACVHLLLNISFKDIIGIENYSSVMLGEKANARIDRNADTARGGALPQLGDIRNCHINIGTGSEISIADLAQLIARTIDFQGTIDFDTSKPDGTLRKLTDVSKLHSLGWHHSVELDEGVARLFQWYKTSIGIF
ncbi:GDP-L-fucose synthase [Hoylesella marshii]|uniref:GDP-L-fucose synthase family protein n=1 Tax=Hoylesella marshii TaxID=189722 RepID=UPI0028D60141|nr:GDP-L-fucose synthase [Hoylesella marshii]